VIVLPARYQSLYLKL